MEFILNSQGGYISFANLNKLHVNTSIDILNDFLHGGGSFMSADFEVHSCRWFHICTYFNQWQRNQLVGFLTY